MEEKKNSSDERFHDEMNGRSHCKNERNLDKKSDCSNIVNQVAEFFFENEEFSAKFEAFINKHAHIINLETDEMKLEYTEVYQAYQTMFEGELEGFIKSKGYSVFDFYDELKVAKRKDPTGGSAVFGQILASIADFDIFLQMMTEVAMTQKMNRK